MKTIVLLTFTFLSSTCNAQSIAIKQERKQNLVKSIPFPFSLYGKNCNSYVVTTNNGKIEQLNSECKFLLYPENIGTVKISVRDKSEKIIIEESYNVKEIDFKLKINNGNQFIENKELFLKDSRFTLYSSDLECLNFEWNCEFELIHIKENQKYKTSILSKNGNLNMLSKNPSELDKEDILIFHDLKILINNNKFQVPDIVLTVR